MTIISNNHNVYPKDLLQIQADFIIGACTSVSHYDPYLGHIYGLCSLLLPKLFIPPRLIVSKVRDLMIFNCALSLCNFFLTVSPFIPTTCQQVFGDNCAITNLCVYKNVTRDNFIDFLPSQISEIFSWYFPFMLTTYHVVFFKCFLNIYA